MTVSNDLPSRPHHRWHVPIRVLGPDSHITDIAPFALAIDLSKSKPSNALASGLKSIQPSAPPAQVEQIGSIPDANKTVRAIYPDGERAQASDSIAHFETKATRSSQPWIRLFDANTRSFVYGL
ncbi:hypothetical protein H1R20_g15910, partial [Candolleomyces eurysporus]